MPPAACAIVATRAFVRRTRSAGASSSSSPRRPALTWIVSNASADSSTTVGRARRCPSGLIPPATYPVARSAALASASFARLPSERRSSCASTGTTAVVSVPSTSATSVLKTRAASSPSFSTASSPYDADRGSCSYSWTSKATPPRVAASTAGVRFPATRARVALSAHGNRGHDGQDRLARASPWVRLPLVRDLRRARLVVRLRALRRAPQGERQGPLARGDGAGARRHRRPRLGDHPPPADLGDLGSRHGLHGPARRLPDMQAAIPRGSPR